METPYVTSASWAPSEDDVQAKPQGGDLFVREAPLNLVAVNQISPGVNPSKLHSCLFLFDRSCLGKGRVAVNSSVPGGIG